jgi:hypothetical protein
MLGKKLRGAHVMTRGGKHIMEALEGGEIQTRTQLV